MEKWSAILFISSIAPVGHLVFVRKKIERERERDSFQRNGMFVEVKFTSV